MSKKKNEKKSAYTLKQRQDAKLKYLRMERAKRLGAEGPKRSMPTGRMTDAQRRAADARLDRMGAITSKRFKDSIGRYLSGRR